MRRRGGMTQKIRGGLNRIDYSNGLSLYLPFIEDFADYSGNNIPVTNNGCSIEINGSIGGYYSCRYDGVNDYLKIQDTPLLSFTDGLNDVPFEIRTVFHNINFSFSDNTSGLQFILDRRNPGFFEYYFVYDSDDRTFLFRLFSQGSPSDYIEVKSNPIPSTWSFATDGGITIQITGDGNKGLVMRINNVIQNSVVEIGNYVKCTSIGGDFLNGTTSFLNRMGDLNAYIYELSITQGRNWTEDELNDSYAKALLFQKLI